MFFFETVLDKLNEFKMSKGLKICHLNSRSLLPKIDKIEYLLLDNYIDIMGFTEAWLHKYIDDKLISKEGYNDIRQDRTNGKRGGGLCLNVKSSIDYVQCIEACNDCDIELLSISVEREYQKDIMVVLLYRPPQGNVDAFLTQLRELLHKHYNNMKQDLVILGDFNIDYQALNSPHFKKLQSLEKEFLLNQIVTNPTRVSLDKASLIDLIFTNIKALYHNLLNI